MAAILLGASPVMAETPGVFPTDLQPIAFDELEGWPEDNHAAALEAFLGSCNRLRTHRPRHRPNGVDPAALQRLCPVAEATAPDDARHFFERHFTPHRVGAEGRLTGYFEPRVTASFERTDIFRYPLRAPPPDLRELPQSAARLGITDDVTWGRETHSGFEAFPDRGSIMDGALDGAGLELVWLESPVDAFFIHIQGSARLAMTDGSARRVNFAGKSGHAYTPIGRTLVERGVMALEDVTMESIRAWLDAADPSDRDAVLASNRSYIFFAMTEDDAPDAGPIAAAGVPLTPGRSLAIDRHLHTFGSMIFVETNLPLPGEQAPLRRLLVAQDTGSAIVGPARGDLFVGSGSEAGRLAGAINHAVRFTVLVPNSSDADKPEHDGSDQDGQQP